MHIQSEGIMPYYSEAESKTLRLNVEEMVLAFARHDEKNDVWLSLIRGGINTLCDTGERWDHSYKA